MYNSPITLFESDQTISEQIAKDTDEYVYKAVLSQNIDVDRDELIKALQYDRDQYDKGYHDAMLEQKNEWISVKDRLPEHHIPVLVVMSEDCMSEDVYVAQRSQDGYWSFRNDYDAFGIWKDEDFKWWMPLPEPPKEEKRE